MSTEEAKTGAPRRTIAIAVTGASGAIYATRAMAALLERGCQILSALGFTHELYASWEGLLGNC